MTLLILSDIHANLSALEAVLDDIPHGPEEILFCGDLLGYYAWPNEVVALAKEHEFLGVRGNHDEAIIQHSTFGFSGPAGIALDWQMDQLTDESRTYVEQLPYSRRERFNETDIYIVHGSPQAPVEEYVYPEQVGKRFLREQEVTPDLLLLGHTHVQFAKQVEGTLVVNPGSVGQPRDGNPEAAYALVEPETLDVDLHRVPYNIDRVAAAVADAELPRRLAQRLYEGQ